mgnify:CR=1 FL=1
MEMIKEFFGFEGYMSFEHLSFVTFLMIVIVMLAIYFGRRYANKNLKENIAIKRYVLTKEDAKAKFANDKFKCELIDAVEDDVVSIYEQGDYSDVCYQCYMRAFCFSPAPLPRYFERASLNFQFRFTRKVRLAGLSAVSSRMP